MNPVDSGEAREKWEALPGGVIDKAYDDCSVLNIPNLHSIVLWNTEDAYSIVEAHNQALSRARMEERNEIAEMADDWGRAHAHNAFGTLYRQFAGEIRRRGEPS